MPNILERTRIISCGFNGYRTNKSDLKSQIENGTPPWTIAWADDISETDVLKGLVSVGVSVASSNPGPFILWIQQLVNRTISTLTSDGAKKFPEQIKDQVTNLTTDIIRQAIKGKSANEVLKKFDTVDFKAGAIKYSGANYVCGKVITRTWGMKPYVGFRWH